MRANPKRWSDEENDRLRRLWDKGLVVKRLCEAFPTRSEGGIRSQIWRLKLGKRHSRGVRKGRFWVVIAKPIAVRATRRANDLGLSRAVYLRNLIVADLDRADY